MSLAISVSGSASDLFAAIGLTGADGRLDESWFDDPIGKVRKVLADPQQRAALLRLVESLLPADAAMPGWHPLLDHELGNIYLTVENEVIGVAAALGHDLVGGVHVRASVRLPLVDVSAELRPVAGSAEDPVRLGIELSFDDPTLPVRGVSADLTVDVDHGAGLVARLTGVNVGAGPVDIVVDSAELGGDLITAVQVLLDQALQTLSAGDPRLSRLAGNLFALLGLDGGSVPPLPIERILANPGAVRDWLLAIAGQPATLTAWATHLAGLIGADLPVTGTATAANPLRAPLLAAGPVELGLVVALSDSGQDLQLGLAVKVATGAADLDASVTALSIPLGPGRTTQVAPRAAVLLRAPGTGQLVSDAPTLQIGTVQAGFRLEQGQVQPWLAFTDVLLDGVDHGTVDLTNADAVIGVVTDEIRGLLAHAFGDNPQGHALLALLGLEAPADDPTTPHLLDAVDLVRSPTAALGGLHRAVLGDPAHPWSAMLGALAALLGLPGSPNGSGSPDLPWVVTIAEAAPVRLQLAAWNARDAQTPAGEQRLRLGLLASAEVAPFSTQLITELLAIDLPATGPGTVSIVAEQRVELKAAPIGPVSTRLGLTAGVDALTGTARWKPGNPLTWQVEVAGLTARAGDEAYGPFTWTWPQGPGPDLGPLGLGLLRLLFREALQAWGGDAPFVLGALLGIHRGLPSLPADWPLLEPPGGGGVTELLADPAAALRDQLHRLIGGVSASGTPFAPTALRIVGALLRSWDAPAGVRPDVDVTVTGSGTYDDPLAVPLPVTGSQGDDLLVWLDPDGPPADWLAGLIGRVASVTSGPQLAEFLGAAAAFHPALRDLLHGRDAATLGTALDGLAGWLHDGDGLVPLAAQLPVAATWTHGSTVAVPHARLSHDAQVVGQVAAQLATWASRQTRAVVLVAPSFADHTSWTELLATVEPDRPAGAHFDLRALPDPAEVDLTTVTAVAAHYTADLLAGAALAETDQLERIVRRVQQLTGAATVTLVAYSTAGITARLLAAQHPELVRGVVTIGTPHTASSLGPLRDAALAGALRVAAGCAAPIADSAVGASIAQLAALLDGMAGPLGGPIDAAGLTAFTDRPAALTGLIESVPGLAIGSALGGDVIGLLSGAVVADLPPVAAAPTHLAAGIRLRLDLPAAAAGEIAVHAHARLDLARIRLVHDAAEPGRPATAASVLMQASRPGGWLAGTDLGVAVSGGADGEGAVGAVQAHVRWLEAGVTVQPGAPGAVSAQPRLRLHDASVGGVVPVTGPLDLAALVTAAQAADAQAAARLTAAFRAALDAVLGELAQAAAGTPARALLDLSRAVGLVFDTTDGVRSAAAGIIALVQTPMATLAAHRDQLLATLADVLGLGAGPLTVTLDPLPVELSLDLANAALRLRTTADLTLAGPLRARLDTTLVTTSLRVRASAALLAGPVALTGNTDGTIVLTAAPWLDHLTVRPFDLAAAEATLTELIPRLGVSAAITVLLGDRVAAAIGPVDGLLRDPAGWLRRSDAFGTDGALDGDKINSLLKTLAGAVGLDATSGLGLPGGYLLSAAGTNPARISLAGTFGAADVAMLAVDAAIDVHADHHVTPAATITATIALPGDWGTIGIGFTLDATGVGLVVTPQQNAEPIRLLPTVDGMGALVGGAIQLLPKLLQETVTWLQAQPGPHDLLQVVLELATALGIYAADAAGFTEPARAARLRQMLGPGWLQHQIADSAAFADLLEGMFGPAPKITLPTGHQISRVEDRVRWTMPVFAGCDVSVELGWSADGAPQVLIGVSGLDTGPVVITEAQLGYLDGLTGTLRLRVDPGGVLAFFAPEIEVAAAGTGLAARILPLGAALADDCAVTIVPTPAVALNADAALRLAADWLVPLLARFLLPLVESLLDTAVWTGGPTTRAVLAGAGLIDPVARPSQLASPLPGLPQLGLGALAAIANDATVHLSSTLDLSAVSESGRLGLRLKGAVVVEGDSVDVTIRLGKADWLTDPAAGITVWVLRQDSTADPPIVVEPALRLTGLGAAVHGHDGNLVDGPVTVGGIAAMVFADVDFFDNGAAHLTVSHLGGAAEVSDAEIVLSSDDADSFVAKVLPKQLQSPFSVAVADRDGTVALYGGTGGSDGGIELTFPLDLDVFGVIFLRELYLAAKAAQGRTDALAAISGDAALGPVAVSVDRVGLQVRVLGPGVQFAFKPPDGFGLSLDVSVVRAGGFLLVDAEHGRYVGAIELAVLQKFDLTAVGIVTTKRPDGSPGYSLLLLITVSLPVPIPIGYGFFFAGAGGLLGLNRGMDVDRIRAGLRDGTADSILFPTDIVRRIDIIVRDLEQSFPQADGHFLVGPMAFIQWMNPALVTAKVGLIIEIGSQPKIALLGVLRVALPEPDAAVVDLKVAFLGSIDIAAGLLSFDASIYDSFIGYGDFKLSLEGDIAIRISWGGQPDLVATLGGFHPAYRPAAHLQLPALRRITLSLLKDNPRITLRLYFAVTSNTVQFGAQLELYAGVSGFSVSGDMGFDVLVQVAPFLIDAHMWAHLAVKAGSTDVCSISLDLSLRGPTPWHAHGVASFSILFISISVEVEASFGADQATMLPSVAVLDRLLSALRDPKNWAAELVAEAAPMVTLLPTGTDLVVDAGGLLSVRQNLIPLATDIGLVGAVPPADITRATITAMTVGTTGASQDGTDFEDVLAGYAPSTFAGAATADADRLRAPAFEQRPTGVRSRGGHALTGDFVLAHPVAYERIILDDPDPSATPPKVIPPVGFGALVAGGAAGSSAGSRLRRANAERGAVVAAAAVEPLYAVTTLGDLRPLDEHGTPVSAGAAGWPAGTLLPRADAESRLAGLRGTGAQLQIIPEVQLVR